MSVAGRLRDATRTDVARELLAAWLHLGVLWSLAFAQPLFDLLADNPEFFVARGNTRADILLFAFGIVIVPPTLMAALEALLIPLGRGPRHALQLVLVGALAAALVLQLLNEVVSSGAVLIPAALALGAGFAVAYDRTRLASGTLTLLAPVPIVFLFLFLVVSPVSELVFPTEAEAVGGVDVRGATPVVMIVFDELSSPSLMDSRHRIDARRYPSFARLANDATWYRNATTVADVTPQAVPALLTGSRPDPDALPIAADHPRNLFTLLGRDYAFEVIEPVTDVCPERLCEEAAREPTSERLSGLLSDLSVVSLHLLLPEGLRDGLPAVDRTFGDFREERPSTAAVQGGDAGRFRLVARRALEDRVRQLDQFRHELGPSSRRPALHYLHVQLPHVAYRYLPTGQRYPVRGKDPPGMEEDRWGGDAWLVEQGFQRYALQLAFVDRFLGSVIQRLRALGLYDRSLIVVTADHGVSFVTNAPRRTMTRRTAAQIAGVPMIVKGPSQRHGRIDDSNVSNLDLLPTIADQLGVDLPWEVDGRSVAKPAGGGPAAVDVLAQTGDHVELSFGELKRRRDATVDWMTAAFPELGESDGMFRFGPDADLVGESVAELAPASGQGARVEVDDAELYALVDPRDSLVPAFVTGRFAEGGANGERLAVAVNGRLEATTRAYEDDGTIRFSAMVPPSAFRRGRNAVDVLAISGEGTARRAAALTGSTERKLPESFRLVKRDGRELLLSASGAQLPVRRGAAQGSYESIDLDYGSGRLAVDGWAAAADRGVADRVVVFVDGRFIVAGRPSRDRPDVARRLGADARASGFSLTGRIDLDTEVDRRSGARVFAIVGDRAGELPRG